MTDAEPKQEFVPTLLHGEDAADALIHMDSPSQSRALFDVYRAYGWPEPDESGAYTTAYVAYRRTRGVHSNALYAPRGVPVYWMRSGTPGLVGISAGHGLVAVSTIDPERVVVVGINWVAEHTGMTYLGWAEDFMGHPVLWDGRTLPL